MAGAFAMLAKRGKAKADLNGSGAESRSSLAASDRANSGGSVAESLVDDAALNARQRPESPWQLTLASSKPFRLTTTQCQVVLDAYAKAVAARRSIADCYRAGVDALYRLRPDVPRQLVAAEAVKILTAERSR
jgi:hypothetical protein